MLFGKGQGNGLDFRDQAFINDENFIRTNVKERILIISIGGDIGQTADVVKTRVKEKKKEQEELEAEHAREIEAREKELEAEQDPELKAAKEKALEARKEALEAEKRVRKADEEVERILQKSKAEENLDAADQGAIQGTTQSGIETIR